MNLSATQRPDEISHLVDLLAWQAARQPDRLAYVFLTDGVETAHLTYQALDRRARAIAGMLQGLGEAGARVLLLYPPGLDYITAFFGCLYAGAVAIPSYPPRLNRPDARLQGIVADSQTRVALTTPAIRSNLERRFDHTPDLAAIHWAVTDDLPDSLGLQWKMPEISGDTLAFLQYTSGSTSTPKGVMVTHGNILSNQRMIRQAFGHEGENIIAGWLPIYHDMGLIGNVLQPLYLGSSCYLMSPAEFLQKPYNWLKLISDTHAHTSGGPNFAYDLCVQKVTPEQRQALDLSHWRVAFNGAEPVRLQTLSRFSEFFEPCGFRPHAFFPCYGLAEATLFVTGERRKTPPFISLAVSAGALAQNRVMPALALGEEDTRMLVSAGRPWPGQAIVIADPETAARCAPDRVGEIWLAGPNVAQGYWNRPDVNRVTFDARLADGSGPYLRTGDLGFVQNGELFVTGRRKDLIILRGRNHYPQDIELTVEQAHPALQSGGGAAFSVEVDGEERLVVVQEVQRAYRNVAVDEVALAVRRAVSVAHELQVYALLLLRPMSVPKTSSGKIQRHQCRQRFLEGSLEVIGSSLQDDVQPVGALGDLSREELLALPQEERLPRLEAWLSGFVARTLQVPDVDPQQPLVALGIDSLAAVELQNHLALHLDVQVAAADFLDGISAADLAGRAHAQIVGEGADAADTAIHPQAGATAWPLSFEQERLWFLEQVNPGNPAYHIPFAVRLRGAIDVSVLEQSLREIANRHTALRITLRMKRGTFLQEVNAGQEIDLFQQDLRPVAAAERATHLRQAISALIQQPFELARGPLWRAALFRIGDDEHVLALVLHHIVSDITSVAVLLREMAALYTAFRTGQAPVLPENPLQYGDFASWLRQQADAGRLAGDLAYWKEQLSGLSQHPWLPTDRPRATWLASRPAQHAFVLPPERVKVLREVGRREGVTLFTTLLAVFYALLHRYSGQRDLCVGVPTQGRWQPETQSAIGFFAYPLALRHRVSGDVTLRTLLAGTREVLRDAYLHQKAPFGQVFQAVRTGPGRSKAPLFPVMFSLVRSPLAGVELPGLTLERVPLEDAATDFDWFLTLVEEDDGRLCGQWGYDAGLFDAQTIAVLSHAFERVLSAWAEQPDLPLSQLDWPVALMPKDFVPEDVVAETPDRQILSIAASFTAEPLAEALNFWIKKLALPLELAFAPYSQVFQQLLDPGSLLNKNARGANLILLRFEDWLRFDDYYRTGDAFSPINLMVMEKNLGDFVAALQAAAGRAKVPYFVFVCPPSPGLLDDPNYQKFCRSWERSQVELAQSGGLYLVSAEEIAAHYPLENYADPQADKLGHIPYTSAFFTALGTMVIRKLHALQRAPYKVVVLDCDQTLWQGVCGEDGWRGVEVTPQHRALQQFMLAQSEAGMLLCLCSKNNETDVWEVFDQHPGMLLNRQHLVAWRINWLPKSENIRSLAQELNLGLDSFVFVDDNPMECAEVRANCPEVVTLQLPAELERIPRFLNNTWVFDRLRVTDADRARTEQYRQNAARERLRQSAPSLNDFLAGLALNVEIVPMTPEQVDRVAQLTQRTNQFNVTTVRRSAQELASLQQSGTMACLCVSVRDRFGDYGLVGAMLFERCPEHLQVDTLLLSCRVLGRQVEHRMLVALAQAARESNLEWVEIPYVPTAKNQPAFDFLNAVGETFRYRRNGGYSFRFPVDALLALNEGDALTRE
ncbi:MAG: HAD-IIIC family phosphatase [Chloroflexota bacterium]